MYKIMQIDANHANCILGITESNFFNNDITLVNTFSNFQITKLVVDLFSSIYGNYIKSTMFNETVKFSKFFYRNISFNCYKILNIVFQ